jgi:hypothetical protein
VDAIYRVPTNHLHIHPEGRRPDRRVAATLLLFPDAPLCSTYAILWEKRKEPES